MSDLAKRSVAVVVAIAAAAVLIYGTYLPYRKSTLFITAIRTTQDAQSLQDFLAPYMAAMDAPSPIGQQELVRNFGSTVAAIANNLRNTQAQLRPELVRALGATMDRYALPVIEQRSGASQAQTFFALATAYDALDGIDDTSGFRDRTEVLIKRGYELSPTRPQFLYLLADFERRYGNETGELKAIERILELWPEDTQVRKVYNTINNENKR